MSTALIISYYVSIYTDTKIEKNTLDIAVFTMSALSPVFENQGEQRHLNS